MSLIFSSQCSTTEIELKFSNRARKVTELTGQPMSWPWARRIIEDAGHEGTFSVTFYNSGESPNFLTKEISGPARNTANSYQRRVTRGKNLPCIHRKQLVTQRPGCILIADADRTERLHMWL